jgi:hypothetical protein
VGGAGVAAAAAAAPDRLGGLVFFVFSTLLTETGRKTVSENASLTVMFAQRRLALPASENQFQPHLKKFI